ncbi:MAG: hypothetical protein IJ057_04395 [Bacteroidales bacterium]|nr:hypothetical protein [Bacteroidales bacterium]
MKRLILFCLLFAMTASMSAQDAVTLQFTAVSQSDAYCPFDYVQVTNLSRGWTEVLHYPDTTLVLACTDGIEVQQAQTMALEVFPNPYNDCASANFSVDEGGTVRIQLRLLNGMFAAEYQGFVEAGKYQVSVVMERPQMALLVVESPGGRQVAKVLQTGFGQGNKLSVKRVEGQKDTPTTRDVVRGYFLPGDTMRYEAVIMDYGTKVYSAEVTQTQYVDETITLDFAVDVPTVNTIDVLDITQTTARGYAEVVESGGLTVLERGVCWSVDPNAFPEQNQIASGMGLGEYFVGIANLAPDTTYFTSRMRRIVLGSRLAR